MDKVIDGGTTHNSNLIVLDEHEQVVPLSKVEQIVRREIIAQAVKQTSTERNPEKTNVWRGE